MANVVLYINNESGEDVPLDYLQFGKQKNIIIKNNTSETFRTYGAILFKIDKEVLLDENLKVNPILCVDVSSRIISLENPKRISVTLRPCLLCKSLGEIHIV